MEDSTTSREKVLKKVRKALINPSKENFSSVDFDSRIYAESAESPEITFAQNFTEASGKFVFCLDKQEILENLQFLMTENSWKKVFCNEAKVEEILGKSGIQMEKDASNVKDCDASITTCEFLVSRTGSICLSSKQTSGRKSLFLPATHIVFAYTSQIVEDVKEALQKLKSKYEGSLPSMFTFVTGPSRTADIEKTIVYGAHGPKEVYVFLIDDLETP